MLRRTLSQASSWRSPSVCLFCAARGRLLSPQSRSFSATGTLLGRSKTPRKAASEKPASNTKDADATSPSPVTSDTTSASSSDTQDAADAEHADKGIVRKHFARSEEEKKGTKEKGKPKKDKVKKDTVKKGKVKKKATVKKDIDTKDTDKKDKDTNEIKAKEKNEKEEDDFDSGVGLTLKEALLAGSRGGIHEPASDLPIEVLSPDDLVFEGVDVDKPPVPMLAYGLDRVLFNPGVYRLQDPRSRVYNFDPYLEKIMPVNEFDFDALSEYKTSSKDEELIAMTRRLGTKFTGSTSSMSSILQHFHYALSKFRKLNHSMMSRAYPDPSEKFSKITTGPSAVFLRYKDGVYAMDADKSYDTPNIMSWLGHSLEKLLTTDRGEFERFRRSSPEKAPAEENSSRCYHYSKQGNFLMRSQLDAHDPRLPGSGVFDLKTRAVVSIRMNHREYEEGLGYQLRYSQGQWESFEREFYDMTRATMLKYSLQVRMGRMDGIFVAYHNIERIFGFQYLSLADMDKVLHGQEDTCLGDQEFKLSIRLLDELLEKAIERFPETSLRLHFETRDTKTPYMYVFAEPVTEEQADEIQNSGEAAQKEFARNVVGVGKDNPEVQAAWQDIQHQVDEQVDADEKGLEANEVEGNETVVESSQVEDAEAAVAEEAAEEVEDEVAGEAVDEVAEESAEEAAEEAAKEVVDEVEVEVVDKGEDGVVDKVEEISDVESESATEAQETEVVEGTSDASLETTEELKKKEEEVVVEKKEVDKGPLVGWTLTVRSKVNGGYVDRPQNLTTEDDWSIEYHIQEIEPKTRWTLYEALKRRRHQLVGMSDKEADTSLVHYRNLINQYSMRGRKWRDAQDRIDREKGVQVFKPLGPGSDAAEEAFVSEQLSGQEEVSVPEQSTEQEEALIPQQPTEQEETASRGKEA